MIAAIFSAAGVKLTVAGATDAAARLIRSYRPNLVLVATAIAGEPFAVVEMAHHDGVPVLVLMASTSSVTSMSPRLCVTPRSARPTMSCGGWSTSVHTSFVEGALPRPASRPVSEVFARLLRSQEYRSSNVSGRHGSSLFLSSQQLCHGHAERVRRRRSVGRDGDWTDGGTIRMSIVDFVQQARADRERLRHLVEGCRIDGEQSRRRALALINMIRMSRRLHRGIERQTRQFALITAVHNHGEPACRGERIPS